MHGRPGEQGDPDDLMTAVDAAWILGISADMVRLLARQGRLRAAVETIRGVRLFRRGNVEQLARERATRARAKSLGRNPLR
jgi:DNA-binding transcriptional MerR regulator